MKSKMGFILAFALIFTCNDVLAYDEDIVHPRITEKAATHPSLDKYLVDNLGFINGLQTRISSDRKLSILDWLAKGSTDEDDPACRATNHFHTPDKPWDQSYLTDVPLGLTSKCSSWKPWYSNVVWGTGYLSPDGPKVTRTNQVMGWDDARDYYYWALTATANKDREAWFAKTFQALGQGMHLIHDISVPAHVRNDFKSHYLSYEPVSSFLKLNRFESYVKENPGLIGKEAPEFPTFPSPRVTDFWDTGQYALTKMVRSDLSIGLAEFTHANYFSDWTVPNNKPDQLHSFSHPVVSSENARICEDLVRGGTEKRKYISRLVKGNDCPPLTEGRTADHFATPSLLNEEWEITDGNISSLKLWLDENVHDTYAKELLPRAVGYSAALLDYFFRGSIEISLPDEGVYALTDKPEEGFRKITLWARNTTPNGEEMPNGSVELVVKYKVAMEDPFQSKPVPISPDFFYRVVPEMNKTRMIPKGDPVKLFFELGKNTIPLWATDVYLQVVYKGDLGLEKDSAVAVGFKDISEPTPVDFVNNLDRICIHGNWYIAGSAEAVEQVDTNADGIADLYDVYPHSVKEIYMKFSASGSPQYASPWVYNYYYKPILEGGRYFRVYILSGYQFQVSSMDVTLGVDGNDTWEHPHRDYYLAKEGVMNQVLHEDMQICCQVTGTPPCGTNYSDPECCENIYSQGCDVRYYPGLSSFRGVLRWKGAMVTQYMPGYPLGTGCNWDLLE